MKIIFFIDLFSGKAPQPRPGYQMPEPDGCSTTLLGFQVPNSVCVFLYLLTLILKSNIFFIH